MNDISIKNIDFFFIIKTLLNNKIKILIITFTLSLIFFLIELSKFSKHLENNLEVEMELHTYHDYSLIKEEIYRLEPLFYQKNHTYNQFVILLDIIENLENFNTSSKNFIIPHLRKNILQNYFAKQNIQINLPENFLIFTEIADQTSKIKIIFSNKNKVEVEKYKNILFNFISDVESKMQKKIKDDVQNNIYLLIDQLDMELITKAHNLEFYKNDLKNLQSDYNLKADNIITRNNTEKLLLLEEDISNAKFVKEYFVSNFDNLLDFYEDPILDVNNINISVIKKNIFSKIIPLTIIMFLLTLTFFVIYDVYRKKH